MAANLLKEKGFKLEERQGRGIRPGARWVAKPPKGSAIEIAVRTGRERSLGFSRLSDGGWRTLQSVEMVLCVVPDDKSSGDFVVLAFDARKLTTEFDKALKALEKEKRAPELDIPIFIPIDNQSKKNVGHNIAGLKDAAAWSLPISSKQLEDYRLNEDLETFIERVKREFAERNEVDVSKVSVEFRILA